MTEWVDHSRAIPFLLARLTNSVVVLKTWPNEFPILETISLLATNTDWSSGILDEHEQMGRSFRYLLLLLPLSQIDTKLPVPLTEWIVQMLRWSSVLVLSFFLRGSFLPRSLRSFVHLRNIFSELLLWFGNYRISLSVSFYFQLNSFHFIFGTYKHLQGISWQTH